MNPVTASSSFSISKASSPKEIEGDALLKPRPLKQGDAIGIFTPSWPAQTHIPEKYQCALEELRKLGFEVVEGALSSSSTSQNYRKGSPKERAEEFMQLIKDPKVKCLIATIGGHNSSSMIEYLDFEEIRKQRKIVCGYSDITSLHFAILKYSKLSTFYGPSLVPIFGEFPRPFEYAVAEFQRAVSSTSKDPIHLKPPEEWSGHFIDARDKKWKEKERKYSKNSGWKIFSPGEVFKKELIVANVETLLSIAGTPIFPEVEDRVLILEETESPFSKMERNYRHLQLMKVFDKIAGLILSKPGSIDSEESGLTREDLLQEIIGKRDYPIILDFDCGHTFPMTTLSQRCTLSIYARGGHPEIVIEEPLVQD